jgi:hypothetical protein
MQTKYTYKYCRCIFWRCKSSFLQERGNTTGTAGLLTFFSLLPPVADSGLMQLLPRMPIVRVGIDKPLIPAMLGVTTDANESLELPVPFANGV